METLGDVIWRPVVETEIDAAISSYAKQPSQQAAERFVRSALPLLKKLLPDSVRRMPDDLRDDLVSHTAVKLLQVLPRLAAMQNRNVCGYVGFVVRNAAMDFFRREQLWRGRVSRATSERRESSNHGGFQSVENDDLMESITAFAAARDGQWGRRTIGIVVRLLARDEPVPVEMLKNWMGVSDPGRLMAFVQESAIKFLVSPDW